MGPNERTVLVRLALWNALSRLHIWLHPGVYSSRRRQQTLSGSNQKVRLCFLWLFYDRETKRFLTVSNTCSWFWWQLSETSIPFWNWGMTFPCTDSPPLTVLLGSFEEGSDGSQVAFVSEEQGLNFTLSDTGQRLRPAFRLKHSWDNRAAAVRCSSHILCLHLCVLPWWRSWCCRWWCAWWPGVLWWRSLRSRLATGCGASRRGKPAARCRCWSYGASFCSCPLWKILKLKTVS